SPNWRSCGVWRTLTYAFVTKTLWNGYQMPSEHGQATNPATMTAAERKRRQRNLLPHLKIFLQKRLPRKATPFLGPNGFWTGFWERGHEQFSESKSPPTGGSHLPPAHPRS